MPNGIDGVVVYYALAKAGLVRVPLNVRETVHEHAYKVEDSQARALVYAGGDPPAHVEVMITADQLPDLIADAPDGPCDVRRDQDAPLRLAYTGGGTTGKPKAVVLTTRSELAEVANFLVDLLPNLRPDSVMLHAAPITHGSGAFFLPHLVKGAPNVIVSKFSPGAFLEAGQKYRATSTFMVPTMIAMLLEDPATAAADLALERCVMGVPPRSPPACSNAESTFSARCSPNSTVRPRHRWRSPACSRGSTPPTGSPPPASPTPSSKSRSGPLTAPCWGGQVRSERS